MQCYKSIYVEIQIKRGEAVAAFLSNHLNKCAHTFRQALTKQTDVILVCNWLDLFYPYILEAEPIWLF